MKSRRLVFLGPPASGKGTQGRRMADEFGLAYLSTGALLRQALRDKSALGEKARPYLDRGEYVPDEVMVPMVLEWVSQQKDGWLLDGFPRTV
ncbi:MAG: nucleoside monophosphate kinase, partial [Akkermansiaceae bacterium]